MKQAEFKIGITGAACRLPGVKDEAEFRRVLNKGLFTVSPGPKGRWKPERLFHPAMNASGAAYTFAGGYLDDPFGFDIGVFGMSPREAAQVDPQQRLLAELVWEALENARIPPDRIAGRDVGVYIGVSALDHANLFAGDPAAIESHFMTGNTLSIVANRISYLFDLKGPSFVVDTACSSSLVAMDRALADLAAGRVEMAIVGGVNMLLSPASFVGFSRAQMLSPTGVCRPFSAKGDGYVRAEGGVVFVLEPSDTARPGSIRAEVLGSAVNSDGRTSGIALPALDGQRAMLRRVYDEIGLDPSMLSFIEAHGTGTVVGDPVEATAIGEVLGRRRDEPLPIGSVKSNIGHLEPASGVAGLLKALIALEQAELPRTLHLDELNPHIDFDALNLLPAANAVPLVGDELHCGVSSFGFGGTNAHVVLRKRKVQTGGNQNLVPITVRERASSREMLMLSAHCQQALEALALAYADRLAAGHDPVQLARATRSGRNLMRRRLVLPVGEAKAMEAALRAYAEREKASAWHDHAEAGAAITEAPRPCFVFSGNGSQWVGMGRDAYLGNRTFRAAFAEAEAAFAEEGLDGLTELLHSPALAERLPEAVVAQPLIFAVQYGLLRALAEEGLRPGSVLGHSVGEISAACAAGAIDVAQAARILTARARSQEALRGKGGMAVFAADREKVEDLIATQGVAGLAIAADNARNSVTVSGSLEAVTALQTRARKQRIASRRLDVAYPYHSPLLDEIEERFFAELGEVRSHASTIPFYSTVTGSRTDCELDARYWWRNVRCPVQFRQAVRAAVTDGANLFIEIGARAVLTANVQSELDDLGVSARAFSSLDEGDFAGHDPIALIVARAWANGLAPEDAGEVGVRVEVVDRNVDLPGYPWQRSRFAYEPTSGAIDLYGVRPGHPLIGHRLIEDGSEWRHVLDASVVPYLADHVVGGEVVVPGTALAEMLLAVAREVFPGKPVAVEDLDILQPMVLTEGQQIEVRVRLAEASGTCTVSSRVRQSGALWSHHATGHIMPARDYRGEGPEAGVGTMRKSRADAIYRKAKRSGIEYGPAFRLLRAATRCDDEVIDVLLDAPLPGAGTFTGEHVLHPASLDAAFHGLFDLVADTQTNPRMWLPVRFERLSVWQDAARIARARIRVDRDGARIKTVSLWLFDAADELVARLDGALLRAAPIQAGDQEKVTGQLLPAPAGLAPKHGLASLLSQSLGEIEVADLSDTWFLLRGHMRAALSAAFAEVANAEGVIDVFDMLARANQDEDARAVLEALIEEALDAEILERCEGDSGQFRLLPPQDLPSPEEILATCLAENPSAAADIGLSAHAAAGLDALLRDGRSWQPRAAMLTRHAAHGLRFAPACDLVERLLEQLSKAGIPPIHVALLHDMGQALLAPLLRMALQGRIRLQVICRNEGEAQRLRRSLPAHARACITTLQAGGAGDIDLCIAIRVGRSTNFDPEILQGRLTQGGAFLLCEIPQDRLSIFQTAGQDIWTGGGADNLSRSDMPFPEVGRCGSPDGPLHARLFAPSPSISTDVLVLGGGGELARLLEAASGPDVKGADEIARLPVFWLAEPAAKHGASDLGSGVLALRKLLFSPAGAGKESPLWVVCRGSAMAAGLRAFLRVAQNEFPDRDLRFVEIAPDLDDLSAAKALLALAARPGDEREWLLDADGAHVPRYGTESLVGLTSTADNVCARLDFPEPGRLEDVRWALAELAPPGPGEVSLEVIATGVNFRDVMLALGMLNDDVLEEGLAGAVYGMECAGRVVACGPGVDALEPGDLVFGFAQDCFASHVNVQANAFLRIPDGLDPVAAAGLPVVFATAWYSLVELARVKAGEKVLIHGGAGGVGLAAIQIAADLGAEVFATVSSADKEALARLYGARHVFDSRSLEFADRIQAEHGGVDVVLNSLSGDAMRASLRALRARGRFVELGKRDYVANSPIALRPFRRNLSYFGVDMDQLMALDEGVAARALAACLAKISDATYLPLPVLEHQAISVAEAFRLMQSAGHVGKVVVRPPDPASVAARTPVGWTAGPGTHLIVGGTRGFGLATALWLAERGASRVVVASRSGEIDIERLPLVEALREKGGVIDAVALDVTDADAVEALVARLASDTRPLEGVWHTAVELRDGLIEGLDEETIAEALAAKVTGAINLDRATRHVPLSQFVVYSSASALIGNPGQGAYAAGNGFVEGLCRERRACGLPALAVMWGAITDTGLLADQADTLSSLERISGVRGMTSTQALNHLGTILPYADHLADPVVACSRFAQGGAAQSLKVMASPIFGAMFDGSAGAVPAAGLSLRELVARHDEADALRLVMGIVTQEVAAILRVAEQDVDLDASIDSLGMDSLMALELRMSLETKYRVELPMMAVTAVGNLRELSRRLISLVSAPSDQDAAQDEGAGVLSEIELALTNIHAEPSPPSPVAAGLTEPSPVKPSGLKRANG